MDFKEENDEGAVTDKKSFTQALREKYCMPDGGGFDSISVISLSPKRKNATAELGHLRTIVLNNMNVMTADIPNQGLMNLCPNVVDLDLANNLMNEWSELHTILSHMPQLKFVNASKNSLNVDLDCSNLPKTTLNIENMALNYTGLSIEDVIHICQAMPKLKELHLCGNDYEDLGSIDGKIRTGALSSLECLRLNSNKIENWKEIWKLRRLPSLKSLILSDNPVSNFFYQDLEHYSDSSVDENSQQDQRHCEYTKSQPEMCPVSDAFDFQESRNNVDDDSQINDGCDRLMDYEEKLIKSIPMMNDEYEVCLDEEARPVSRIGRHYDSDAEDEGGNYSDDEEEFLLFGLPEDDRNDQLVTPYQVFDESKESNESFNTNSSILTVTDDDSLMEKATDTESSDADLPKERGDQCQYAMIAESFLYDILDTIDKTAEANKLACDFPPNTSLHSTSDIVSSSLYDAPLDNKREDRSKSEDESCQRNEIRVVCSKCGNAITVSDKSEHSEDNAPHNGNFNNSNSENGIKNDTYVCNKCHTPFSATEVTGHPPGSTNLSTNSSKNVTPSGNNSGCTDTDSRCQLPNQPPETNINNSVEGSNQCHIAPEQSGIESVSNTQTGDDSRLAPKIVPFENLELLCLSNTGLSHWKDLHVFSQFPRLSSLRVQSNPLYSSVKLEDRRKLYIASLPNIKILNGSEVSATEREKAERHYLRHFMHKNEKPDIYHTLVEKHDEPVELVDIDLSARYHEWAELDFIFEGHKKFSKKVRLTEQVGKLRTLISKQLLLPKRCFKMHFNPCSDVHPVYERDMTELRCECLPMSRFDFADGDEIHVEIIRFKPRCL